MVKDNKVLANSLNGVSGDIRIVVEVANDVRDLIKLLDDKHLIMGVNINVDQSGFVGLDIMVGNPWH